MAVMTTGMHLAIYIGFKIECIMLLYRQGIDICTEEAIALPDLAPWIMPMRPVPRSAST